ncbi:hypothetical protein ACHAWU_004642 [Discostella pseudostelligera]|uniref:SAP domain-containing protein n=1 Tax=Discostella pseudostelligera TaxID=259834 RepID=A0ABD3N5L7_9STRA
MRFSPISLVILASLHLARLHTHDVHAFSITTSISNVASTYSSSSSAASASNMSLMTSSSVKMKVVQTQLSSTAKDDSEGGSGGGGGGGWYDDYDDFVSKLNFEGGGWDNSGASTSGGGNYDSSNRSSRPGRGGGRSSGRSNSSSSRTGVRNVYSHDYQRDTSRDASFIPEDTMPIIEKLLASRLDYRKRRMFDEADGIRDELLNVHGVTVWDKEKTWSTGGGGGNGGGGGSGRGERINRFSDRLDGRGRGRGAGGRGAGRGRGSGDRIGRGGGGAARRENKFNEHGHDYSQVGGPINPSTCSLTESEIHDRIRSRMECKFARDFNTADRIEYELRQAGVLVHDGFKEWRADGDEQDELSSWGGRRGGGRGGDERRGSGRFGGGPKPPKVYNQRGPGKDLTADDVATISALVAERSEAKSTMDYDRADVIFDQLTNEFNVNIDDKSGEWALLHEEYQLNINESAFVPDENVQVMIGKKLGDRILARKARNFDLADDIRDELLNEYVVEIDDRAKEWMVSNPRGGQWSLNGDNEVNNIVSKQEWDEEDDVDDDGDDSNSNNGWEENDDEDDSVGLREDDDEFNESNTGNVSSSSSSSLSESTLLELTVPELKEKLREAGLPLSGRKSELILRLLES